ALRTGTTTLVDDMNVYPVLRPDHVEAAFEAYNQVGIRAYLGTTLFDLPYHKSVPFAEEIIPDSVHRQLQVPTRTPAKELISFARHLAAKYEPRRDRVAYIVSPSAPQRCSREFLL